MRIIGRIHQDVVPQKAGNAVEHVLPFVHFDATEEPSTSEVVAWPVLEWRRASHTGVRSVHPPSPEGHPPEAAFQKPHPQVRIAIHDPRANTACHKSTGPPGM